jgi:lysophospholipase L1-like esterase
MLGRRWWVAGFALLAAIALACDGEGTGLGGGLGASKTPRPPVAGLPTSMAALGDSITIGYASCLALSNCPRNSWSTGDGLLVDSHYRRILAGNPAIKGHAQNYAAAGATAAGLAGQASRAVGGQPDYLTIMIGANDACRSSVEAMTSTSTFASEVGAALATIKSESPRTRILMVSIPDVYRVWDVGHTSRLARSVWSTGICQALLANPTSTADADVARRRQFRDRVDAYDRLLARACADYGHRCRWDGGVVHGFGFGIDKLSGIDFFHPNASGQSEIAKLTYPRSFTW